MESIPEESAAPPEHGIRMITGRRAWAGLAVSTVVIAGLGVVLIQAFRGYRNALDRTAALSPDAAILQAGWSLRVLAMVMCALAIGTALYTARSSREVLRHRQIPPPGAQVFGSPTIVYGTRAAIWGGVGYVLAALLTGLALVFTSLLLEFVDLMVSGIG